MNLRIAISLARYAENPLPERWAVKIAVDALEGGPDACTLPVRKLCEAHGGPERDPFHAVVGRPRRDVPTDIEELDREASAEMWEQDGCGKGVRHRVWLHATQNRGDRKNHQHW